MLAKQIQRVPVQTCLWAQFIILKGKNWTWSLSFFLELWSSMVWLQEKKKRKEERFQKEVWSIKKGSHPLSPQDHCSRKRQKKFLERFTQSRGSGPGLTARHVLFLLGRRQFHLHSLAWETEPLRAAACYKVMVVPSCKYRYPVLTAPTLFFFLPPASLFSQLI